MRPHPRGDDPEKQVSPPATTTGGPTKSNDTTTLAQTHADVIHVEILAYTPWQVGALCGRADIKVHPIGLVLQQVGIMRQGAEQWLAFRPIPRVKDEKLVRRSTGGYVSDALVELHGADAARFTNLVLKALEQHLGGQNV